MEREEHGENDGSDPPAIADETVTTPRTAMNTTVDNEVNVLPSDHPLHPPQSELEVYDPTPVIRGYDTSEAVIPVPPEAHTTNPPVSTTHSVPTSIASSIATPEQAQVLDASPSNPVTISTETVTSNDALPLVQNPADDVAAATLCTDEPAVDGPLPTHEVVVQPPVDPLKARVRETWSLMFSSRFEDEVANEEPVRNDARIGSNAVRSTKIQSSLRTKLERERYLDEQIQSAISVNARPQSSRRISSEDMSIPVKTSRRRPKPVGWLAEDRPFEAAGLVATAVRFCMEKAMLQTVQCLAELHAIAQDEPKPTGSDIVLGVFVTQWELQQVLRDLLGSSVPTVTTSHVCLHNPEYANLSLETLLQVSWFLPLDDFPRLRQLVADISRKRVSEAKLAILNGILHRHFILRPHPGVRMQRLLLRIIDALVPNAKTTEPYTNQTVDALNDQVQFDIVRELLHALHIRLPSSQTDEALPITAFLQLTPFDLQCRFQVSSVISLQRLIYFRFFIEALATHKANQACGTNSWWPRSTGKPQANERQKFDAISELSTPMRSTAKRKKKVMKPHPSVVSTEISTRPDDPTDPGSERRVGWSTVATHGSAPSPRQEAIAPVNAEDSSHNDTEDTTEFSRLNDALTVAMTKFVRANPWLVDDSEIQAPSTAVAVAMRATFFAAETFQQSVAVLSGTATPSMLTKMEEFTNMLNSLAEVHPVEHIPIEPVGPPPAFTPRNELISEPAKPAPSLVQRANSGSFPPPYVSTSPAYWTFKPEIPPLSTPTSRIPQSVAKRTDSPGVGDYDITRGDKLTFTQRAGHSFGKPTEKDDIKISSTPIKPPSTAKSRVLEESVPKESLEPPGYTYWASAAEDTTNDEEQDANNAIEIQVRDALRLQQSFVLDDLVQNLLHRGQPVARIQQTNPRMSQPQSATSRVVSRVRTIATARTVTAPKERTPKPHTQSPTVTPTHKTKRPVTQRPLEMKQPPRDYEPPADDAHLHWATRVSEFYKAQLKITNAGVS